MDRRGCLIAALAASPAAWGTPTSAPLKAAAPGSHDAMGVYTVQVLNEALQRLRQPPLALIPSDQSPGRIAHEVSTPHGAFDILWGMAQPEWEQRFAPVRFALDRGLLGVRVLVAREAWLEAVDWQGLMRRPPIDLLRALQAFPMGSGLHWPDTPILRANGLRIETAASADPLFRMLQAGRIDLLPRSVLEVQAELAAHRELGLTVVPQVALAYPAVSQAYVRRERGDLARKLADTLRLMAQQGRIRRLFDAQFQTDLDRLQVATRRLVWLHNPQAPDSAARPEPPLPWLTPPK